MHQHSPLTIPAALSLDALHALTQQLRAEVATPSAPAAPVRYATGSQRDELTRLLRSTRLSAATKTRYLLRLPALTQGAAQQAIGSLRWLIRADILNTTDTQAA
jgi:hypothetical protein